MQFSNFLPKIAMRACSNNYDTTITQRIIKQTSKRDSYKDRFVEIAKGQRGQREYNIP